MEAPPQNCPRCGQILTVGRSPQDCPTCQVRSVLGPAPDDTAAARRLLGIRIGNYELVSFIARGGTGDVYRAHQPDLQRDVAFKVARPDRVLGETERRRFQSDAEVAAQLDHPNIVPIFEVGAVDGRPYFSMPLIEGGSLAGLLEEERQAGAPPPSGPRLRFAVMLMIKVSRAVHYAHTKGVLHRDLKPANILLSLDEEPFLTDFGLAKRVEEDLGLTLTGEVMGTPCYMSPEQAQGATGEVTIFTDIYGLGAILYELLTGHPPHQGRTLPEIIHKVAHDEVARPRARNRHVARDLETICLKCLARDPAQRYPSADAMAEDLEHWLRGEPIKARPVPWWERLWKWIRRKPDKAGLIGVAAASAALLLLAGLGIKHGIDRNHRRERFNQAIAHFDDGQPASAVAALSRLVGTHPDFDLAAARLAGALTQHPFPTATLPHPAPVTDIAYAPDDALLVTGDTQGAIRIWSTPRGELEATLIRPDRPPPPGQEADGVQCVVFLPHGAEILAGFDSGRVEHWNWRERSLRSEQILEGLVRALRVIPNAHRVVAVSRGELRITDPATGQSWSRRDGTNVFFCAAVDPQGRFIATGNAGAGGILLWTATQGTLVSRWEEHQGTVRTLQFSADGALLISSSDDGTARVRRIDARGQEPVVLRHPQPVLSAMPDPSGSSIVTLAGDQRVRVWDAATGGLRTDPLPAPAKGAQVSAAFFHPRGGYLVTALNDGRVWIRDARSGQPFGAPAVHELRPPFSEFPYLDQVVVAGDGAQYATVAADQSVRLWSFPGRQIPVRPLRGEVSRRGYQMAPGDRYAWSTGEGILRARRLLPEPGQAREFACPVEGRLFPSPTTALTLVAGQDDGGAVMLVGEGLDAPRVVSTNLTLVDAGWGSDGRRFWLRTPDRIEVREMAEPDRTAFEWRVEPGLLWSELSPDNTTLAWATRAEAGFQSLAEPARAARRVALPGVPDSSLIRFSADAGRLLVAATNDQVLLIDVARARVESVFVHTNTVQAAAMSGDGSSVATLTASRHLALWRAGRDRKPESEQELNFPAYSIAMSRDGRRLALASPEQFLMLLDLPSGQAITDRIQVGGSVRKIRFAGDDGWVVADMQDSPVLWERPPEFAPAPAWLGMMGEHAAWRLLGDPSAGGEPDGTARRVLSLARGGSSRQDAAARWAAWWHADPRERTVSPGSPVRAMDYLFQTGAPTPARTP